MTGATKVRAGTSVRGDIRGPQDLVVEGRLTGEVDVEGDLVIGPNGVLRGDVRARSVRVFGILVGSVRARKEIAIHTNARVSGELAAPAIDVDVEAMHRGTRDASLPAEVAPSANRMLWEALPGQARQIPREPPADLLPSVGRSAGRMRIPT